MDTGEVERVEDQKFLPQLGGAHTKKKTKNVSLPHVEGWSGWDSICQYSATVIVTFRIFSNSRGRIKAKGYFSSKFNLLFD